MACPAGDVAHRTAHGGHDGAPQIVPLTHANLGASAENMRRRWPWADVRPLPERDAALSCARARRALLASLAAWASVVCAPGFSAPEFFRWLATFRPTWYTAVPAIHQAHPLRVTGGTLGRGPRASLRFIRSTSASLAPAVLAELEHVFGAPVIEAYGTTEASMITCNPLPPGVRKSGSVGLVAGPEVALRDAPGPRARVGEPGEIAVRGPTVIAGYEGDPIANETAFADGWFRTGDQGSSMRRLSLHHRPIEDTINRGGENSPHEVDGVLMDHPAVAQAVTFAVPHARLGEDVAAAVVLRPHATETADEIRRFVATRLAAFKVPQQVFIVEDIPKGPTGKLQRMGSAERLGRTAPDQAQPAMQTDFTAPRTPMEKLLSGLWTQVLGLDRVGIYDDFFHFGGDSLLATQIISRVREATHVELTFRSFFDTPTIAGMARSIEASGRVVPGLVAPPMYPVLRERTSPSFLCPATPLVP